MKKLILSLGIVFGVFVALGSVSAASEDDLQPAEGIGPTYSPVYASYIYNNGVSYLRGTIINNSEVAMDGTDRMRVGNFPVTIGDDLRVNGRIDRMGLGGSPVIIADNLQVDGEITNGSGNVKLADTLQPVASDTYDLGTDSNRWRDGYFGGKLIVGGMNEEGCNNREGILCVGNNDYNTVIYRDGRIREVNHPKSNPRDIRFII